MRTFLAALITTAALTIPAAPATATPTKPCEYEDSRSCVWDARHMGNGSGRSFVTDARGHVRFVSHARAHTLAFGHR